MNLPYVFDHHVLAFFSLFGVRIAFTPHATSCSEMVLLRCPIFLTCCIDFPCCIVLCCAFVRMCICDASVSFGCVYNLFLAMSLCVIRLCSVIFSLFPFDDRIKREKFYNFKQISLIYCFRSSVQ